MKLNRFLARTAMSAAFVLGLAAAAEAQFPDHDIQVIFPWPPGVTMAASQVMTKALGEELDVNLTVVSMPGGTGVKAMKTAMSRPSDGYTIFDGWVAPLVVQSLLGHVKADQHDFKPLYALGGVPNGLLVRRDDKRFPDFKTFIQYMKDHPGELRYTAGAYGNLPNIDIANMEKVTDTVAQNVPYAEVEEGVKDLRSGVLDFMAGNPGFYRANKDSTRVLVAFSNLDSVAQAFGGVPKISDEGIGYPLTGLAPMGWDWWLVNKDTPDDVVKILRDAMGRALKRPEVKAYFDKIGRVLLAYPPEKYLETVGEVRKQLSTASDAIKWEANKLKSVK